MRSALARENAIDYPGNVLARSGRPGEHAKNGLCRDGENVVF